MSAQILDNTTVSYHPEISADGHTLLFISDRDGIERGWSQNLATLKTHCIDLFSSDERIVQFVASPTESSSYLAIYDINGDEQYQLCLISDNSRLDITAGFEQCSHNSVVWLPDGSAIIFAANRRQVDKFDLYYWDRAGNESLVYENDSSGYLYDMAVSPDLSRLAVSRYKSSYSHELIIFELRQHRLTKPRIVLQGAKFMLPQFERDASAIWLLTDQDSEYVDLVHFDLSAERADRKIQLDADIEVFKFDAMRQTLVFMFNNLGRSQINACFLNTGAVQECDYVLEKIGVAGAKDKILCLDPNGGAVYFSFSSIHEATAIFRWNFAANFTDCLSRIDRPPILETANSRHIASSANISAELFQYMSFDNTAITGWIISREGMNLAETPCLVLIHGGPESQFRPSYSKFANFLVDNGVIVVAPNVRGSSGFGKSYAMLDDKEKRMDAISDIVACGRWVADSLAIEPSQQYICGSSYGGYATLMALAHSPSTWAGGISISGMTDLVAFLENTSPYRRVFREAEYGTLSDDRALLASISPITNIEKIKAPILLVHGKRDPRVIVDDVEVFATELRSRGNAVQELYFEDEGHAIKRAPNIALMYRTIRDFVKAKDYKAYD